MIKIIQILENLFGITNGFHESAGNTIAPYFNVIPEYNNTTGASYYWYMGKTYDLETPKHLVLFRSNKFNLDEHLKVNRYFILEGKSHNPVDYRKFWYFDIPNIENTSYDTNIYTSNFDATLFKTSTKFYPIVTSYMNEYTFKYVNLDDPNDIKDDIILTPIGLTRKNPWKELFNSIIEFGNYTFKTTGAIQQRSFLDEIYIGNWITPQAGVKTDD